MLDYIVKTPRGLYLLDETGQGYTNTGESQIVTAPDGSMPKAYTAINGRGEYIISIPITVGSYVIRCWRKRETNTIEIYRVVNIIDKICNISNLPQPGIPHTTPDGDGNVTYSVADMVNVNSFDGDWSEPLQSHLVKAVAAAIDKTKCYHCRCSHWAVVENRDPLGQSPEFPHLSLEAL